MRKNTTAAALGSNMSALLRLQLASSIALPPEVHEAAFAMASKAGNVEVLALLAGRPDAPKSLLQAYREQPEIPIRVAFLSRPEHDDAFLRSEIKEEKRAGVLAALVSDRNTSKPVVEAVASAFVEKPTVTLAKALAPFDLSPKANMAILSVLASRFTTFPSTLQSQLLSIASSLAGSPHREAAALIAADEHLAARFISATGISASTRVTLLERLTSAHLEGAKAHGRNRSYHGNNHARSVMTAVTSALSCADVQAEVVNYVLGTIATSTGLTPAEAATISSLVRDLDGSPQADTTTTPASTASGADLVSILAQLGTSPELALELVSNPNLTMEQATNVVKAANRIGLHNSTLRLATPQVLDAVAVVSPEVFVKAGGFSLYEDPSAAELRIVRSASVSTTKESPYRLQSRLAGLYRLPLTEVGFLAFPWSVVSTAMTSYYVDSNLAALAARMGPAQARILGSSEERWEMFNSLADGFDGSIGELLETVEALCSPQV